MTSETDLLRLKTVAELWEVYVAEVFAEDWEDMPEKYREFIKGQFMAGVSVAALLAANGVPLEKIMAEVREYRKRSPALPKISEFLRPGRN